MKKTIKNIEYVLSQKNHVLYFLLAGVLVFIVLYALTLATTTDHSLEIFVMMNGFSYTLATLLMFVAISLLFGLYVSLAVYTFRINKASVRKNSAGFFGFIAGIFGAGCPMCGSAVFGLFGAPLALFFLPFKGLELRALSIVLLVVSVFLISRNLKNCNRCRIK